MSKHSRSALGAFVLAAVLCSSSASAQTGVLQRCDKPMADVEQMSRTIAECDALLKGASAALAKVDDSKAGPAEKVVTTTSSLPVDLTRAAMAEPLHGRLVAYYAYSAFAAGDPAQCAVLSHVGGAEALCRGLVADLFLVRARYGSDAEFVKACRWTDGGTDEKGNAPWCCSQLAQNRARPDACAGLVPKCMTDAATCRAFFASMAGDARACRSLPMPPPEDCVVDDCRKVHAESVANCEGDALFAKAFKAGSAASCGGSQRCRALMGEGKAVAQEIAARDLKNPVGAWFLRNGWKTPSVVARTREPAKAAPAAAAMKKIEFRGFVCAEPMTSKENRAALGAVLAAAHACLADVETALSRPSREISDGLDQREETIARYSLRLNKYFEGKPAKAPAPAPK